MRSAECRVHSSQLGALTAQPTPPAGEGAVVALLNSQRGGGMSLLFPVPLLPLLLPPLSSRGGGRERWNEITREGEKYVCTVPGTGCCFHVRLSFFLSFFLSLARPSLTVSLILSLTLYLSFSLIYSLLRSREWQDE